MSDVKHSPLPWKVNQTYSAHAVSIVGSDGRLVTTSTWHENNPYYLTQAQTYANFYLIASAVNSAAAKDARIAELEAQNEWLKNRLAYLQRPTNSSKSIEEWLVECGMPPLSATTIPVERPIGIDIPRLPVGTPVTKAAGYPFPGIVVSAFHTLSGQERFVVEATGEAYAGLLHIYNGDQLRATTGGRDDG